jgi:2'-5' RNA ligase
MSRLFLGTFLPEEDQQRLRVVQESNRDLDSRWNCRIRWVQPKKLHLTWMFLGDVEPRHVDDLKRALTEMKAGFISPGDIVYDRMEVWFGRDLPRHLVLTPSAVPPDFIRLVTLVRNKLLDFAGEDYRQQAKDKFRPHITLMRFQKLDDQDHRLPLESNSTGAHPFAEKRKLRMKELPAGAINGMSEILPIRQPLNSVALISSNQADNSHSYSIVKSLPLS